MANFSDHEPVFSLSITRLASNLTVENKLENTSERSSSIALSCPDRGLKLLWTELGRKGGVVRTSTRMERDLAKIRSIILLACGGSMEWHLK